MSGRVVWNARMPHEFVLMIGAMVILVVATWSVMGIMADSDAVTAESKYQFMAVAAGQAVIGEARVKAFDAGRVVGGGVLGDPFAHFPREVESGKSLVTLLEQFHHADALPVVLKAAVVLEKTLESRLPGVAEGGVAEVVGEGDGFGEVLVEA